MQPIGTIRTPFTDPADMPIQPKGAAETKGKVVVAEQFMAGLKDLEGFSHIYLLYEFHRVERMELTVTPFMDNHPRGVFATRSPLRPNHIGLSLVELLEVKDNVLTIKGVDILDNTPLLDIKPYIDGFDRIEESRSGWMQASEAEVRAKRSDARFS